MRLALEENERALKILEEQQKNRDDAAMAEDRVAEYCRKFSEGLDDLDQEGRRAVFSAFGAKFTATRDELQVSITVDPAVTAIDSALAINQLSYSQSATLTETSLPGNRRTSRSSNVGPSKAGQ